MSKTRGVNSEVRHDFDWYETPGWMVWALLREWSPPGVTNWSRWLEPCAGDGAIIRAVHRRGWNVFWNAVELRSEARKQLSILNAEICDTSRDYGDVALDYDCPENFLMWEPSSWDLGIHGKFDVGITNPAFRLALPIIERTLMFCDHVAMLLPFAFLASQERLPFHQAHPCDMWGPITPRASFTRDGGTDSVEYSWFTWPGTGKFKLIDAVDLRDQWEAEQDVIRRAKPSKIIIDQLPLFKRT